MPMIAQRVKTVQPSPTLAMNALAKDMQGKGIDVINLTAGEPDFDTPQNIKDAAIRSMELGFTKYTAVEGILPLRQAICKKLKEDNGVEYRPEEIIVSCGAKHVIYNVMQALLDPGDEVVIPVPYWVSYAEQVRLAGGTPVFTHSENCRITADALRPAITEKTKIMIINSPNNPTGFVLDKTELEKIAELALEKNILVLSDEIYEKLMYGGSHYSIASLSEEMKERTITVNGVSKSHAMTGWRIGYAAAPVEIIKAMNTIQSHSTSNATSIAQMGALEALTGPQDFVETICEEFRKRRDFVVGELNSIEGIACQQPEGAFYVFADVSRLSPDSLKFSSVLLKDAKVAVVPGIAFGREGFVRISYAVSMDALKEGMNRIRKFAKENTK